ncbi:hypothetical protein DPMN_038341 [Dreissena polymorpha]|uniref:Uncharacterized protein n=1 Tax=Dreissena polymorpha TaxID=45954 RepID=A0A9D4MG51_DREPO|nr:hypothetical protein DPMN_038341 [Dreissena polymorpha]
MLKTRLWMVEVMSSSCSEKNLTPMRYDLRNGEVARQITIVPYMENSAEITVIVVI